MKLRIKQRSAIEYYKNFLSWDIKRQNEELLRQPASFWEEMGQLKAVEVFQEAAKRVPAYQKFLAEHGVNPDQIQSFTDFQQVPVISKENYLKKYLLHELCWDGDMRGMNVISVSSGTSGKPFFWPRDIWQEKEVDHFYELTLRYLFGADEKRTLVLVAFAMGMYIAGPFTFSSCLRLGQKGYPISVVTPSNDIEAILRVVTDLSGEFDQIVIGGYPPLVRDIIDSGVRAGIDWKAKHTKLFFGGESFSEKWRDYIHNLIDGEGLLKSTINMYGTADASLLGIETPASILLRRATAANKSSLKALFGSERLPSLLSYNPLFDYFETTSEGNLVFTTSSGVPLVRYRIGDVGGTISYDKAQDTADELGIDLTGEIEKAGLADANWKLPMVYLFGRDDFTVVLYGANVYPENIKEALDDPRISHWVSGKYIIKKKDFQEANPYLLIQVELAAGINPEPTMNVLIKKVIIETLREKNSEYNDAYNARGRKLDPRIKLIEFGSHSFKINIKHNWVKKPSA